MVLHKNWQHFIFFIKIAVGLILLGFLLSKVDWYNLLESFRHMKISSIAVAFIFFSGAIFAESLRLWISFRNYSVNIINSLRMNIVGSVFGIITPGQIGSDIYKVYAIRERGNGFVKPIFLLMFVRVCGAVALILSCILAVLLNVKLIEELLLSGYLRLMPFLNDRYTAIAVIAAIIILAGIVATRFGILKIKKVMSGLVSGYSQAQSEITWRVFNLLFLLSLGIMLFRVAMIFFLVISLGYEVGIGQLLLVVTLAMIGTMLPVSVGGLGVREGIIVVLLQLFNMPYEPATIVALISRTFLIITALTGFVWYYLSGKANTKMINSKI